MAFTKAKPSVNKTVEKIPVYIGNRTFTIFKVLTPKGKTAYKYQNGRLHSTKEAAIRALKRHLSIS